VSRYAERTAVSTRSAAEIQRTLAREEGPFWALCGPQTAARGLPRVGGLGYPLRASPWLSGPKNGKSGIPAHAEAAATALARRADPTAARGGLRDGSVGRAAGRRGI